jgi:hypothetical protein
MNLRYGLLCGATPQLAGAPLALALLLGSVLCLAWVASVVRNAARGFTYKKGKWQPPLFVFDVSGSREDGKVFRAESPIEFWLLVSAQVALALLVGGVFAFFAVQAWMDSTN